MGHRDKATHLGSEADRPTHLSQGIIMQGGHCSQIQLMQLSPSTASVPVSALRACSWWGAAAAANRGAALQGNDPTVSCSAST